ncbi:MAG: RNA methyltransferase [Hyphomicrobiales bacterium]|nr:RNA methyltransferase [Hyphomicrobiales bacterium]MDE2017970.1 RNA methyltransferase [Hyphomicrobiales bacterium]
MARDGHGGKRSDRDGRRRGDRPREGAGPERPPREAAPRMAAKRPLIWGFHAAAAALKARRREIVRIHATAAAAERLVADGLAKPGEIAVVDQAALAALLPRDAVHQGVAVEAGPLPELGLEDVPDGGLVLVLDQVTDPHNFGAILRTAAAFGVDAVVTTDRHAPPLTDVVAKAASGGAEFTPVVRVVNLARALDELGERGFHRVGLDSEGDADLAALAPRRPLALALGAEGAGLRRLTRERCDALARIDLPGPIKSLNVSNACAVALACVTATSRE